MREQGWPIEVSSTFTIFFDGRFWVGVIERRCEGAIEARRIIFGAEPTNEEIHALVLESWGRIELSQAIACESMRKPRSNPKRRQREAAREAARARPSTKAQEALAREREILVDDARTRRSEDKREGARKRYALRQEKRKRKHRGR
ncbi:MAG: YjdF family protein [Collinsella sp.]|nr:YjdF family protein [Collinsella sp.]